MISRLTCKIALEADGFARGVERALDQIDSLAATEAVVDAVFEALSPDERTVLLLLHLCGETPPVLVVSTRYRELGLLAEDTTLSGLGRCVAERILENLDGYAGGGESCRD